MSEGKGSFLSNKKYRNVLRQVRRRNRGRNNEWKVYTGARLM